ncbi:MAG TPA: O-antigen ligase family protein, partial [bacterium]|nr:O-antigen ligase family protein [bacterium]
AMAFEHKEIQKLLLFFTYGAAFCALFGIGKHFCLHQERIDSFSGDKMVFGGMLMAGLLIQLFFLKNEPKNLLHWLSLVLLGWALVLTETRGAWVGLLVGFALLSWRFNRKWLAIGLALLVVSYFLMPSVLQNRIKSMANIQLSYDENHQIQNSSQVRLLIWLSGIKIIKDYPWGVGQGNLSDIYPRYRLAALDKFEPTVPHLHNNFLQILVQNGWIGLAAYLFWIFSYFRGALGFKGKGDGPQDLNWTLICVFAAVLAWGLTEYTFSHQFMNVQFFLLGLQAALWKQGGAPTV